MNYDIAIIGLGIYCLGLTILFIYHLLSYKDKVRLIVNDIIIVREKLNNEQIKHYTDTELSKHKKNIATWVDDIGNNIKKTNDSIRAANASSKEEKAKLLQIEASYDLLNDNVNDIIKELNNNIDAQNEINVKATETFSIIQTTLQALQLHNEQQDQLLADFVNKRIFNKESEKSEYVPYGPEWQKEMMKWTKKELVEYMGKFFKERSATK